MSGANRLIVSIPNASGDGKFYGRYPDGNAPSGAQLQPRVTGASNFSYLGYFKLPPQGTDPYPLNGEYDESNWNYGATGVAIGPGGNTLWASNIFNHADPGGSIGLVNIPTDAAISAYATNPATATVATYLNAGKNEGISGYVHANSSEQVAGTAPNIGWACYDSGRLTASYVWFYNGGTGTQQHKNAVIVSGDLSTITIDQQIGDVYDAATYAGAIGPIAPEWQSLLGGTHLVGNGTFVQNSQRVSRGPDAHAIDISMVGTVNPVPATTLVFYPLSNPVTDWTLGNNLLSNRDTCATLFLPTGTRSIVRIGTHGTGPYRYGPGTSNQALDNQSVFVTVAGTIDSGALNQITGVAVNGPTGGVPMDASFVGAAVTGPGIAANTTVGAWDDTNKIATLSQPASSASSGQTFTFTTDVDMYCYDPTDYSKGVHSYPYKYWVWLTDANDCLPVKAGSEPTYTPQPYAAFELTGVPDVAEGSAYQIAGGNGGGCFDPVTNRVYIFARGGQSPEIHVWQFILPPA